MAETSEIRDGKLELTETRDVVIITMTKEEVVGKVAEAQTIVDHLEIDLGDAQKEVTKWVNHLNEFDK